MYEPGGDMQKQKTTIRASMQARRRRQTAGERQRARLEVARRGIGLLEDRSPRSIHIYQGQYRLGEIDTNFLVTRLHECFPGVLIDQPVAKSSAPLPVDEYDVVFVPVVAFDRGGFRLGMGGGWYDQFLSKQPRALKIGLAYEWAEVPKLPRESHDIRLDVVITPEKIHYFQQ